MTNSFRPQAAPVDTFVRPVSVAPPTDLDVLARALKAVNPGIEAFLDNKMDEAIEDEKSEAIYDTAEKYRNEFKNQINKLRKTDGDGIADIVAGKSIFYKAAAEENWASLISSGLNGSMQRAYQNDLINGKPLWEYELNSSEVQDWLSNTCLLYTSPSPRD